MERSAEKITVGLNGTWKNGKGQACCPAHDDKTPSLSIEDKDGGSCFITAFRAVLTRNKDLPTFTAWALRPDGPDLPL